MKAAGSLPSFETPLVIPQTSSPHHQQPNEAESSDLPRSRDEGPKTGTGILLKRSYTSPPLTSTQTSTSFAKHGAHRSLIRMKAEAAVLRKARLHRGSGSVMDKQTASQWMNPFWIPTTTSSRNQQLSGLHDRVANRGRRRTILKCHSSSQLQKNRMMAQEKYRIMMLISDTGGGHRASADALAAAIHHQYPDLCDIDIVDIWTDYGVWPFNTFVPAYKYLCDNPQYWRMIYDYTKSRFSQQFISMSGYALCGAKFRKVFEEVKPNLVCSVHPLCQDVPLRILEELPQPPIPRIGRPLSIATNTSAHFSSSTLHQKACELDSLKTLSPDKPQSRSSSSLPAPPSIGQESSSSKSSSLLQAESIRSQRRQVPFVTVVTDLGGAHPTWFHPDVDLCFVPSKQVEAAALAENLKAEQIRLYGLPIRSPFWKPDPRPKSDIQEHLGLNPGIPVCLIVGGGDGVGGIVPLASELVRVLGECNDKSFQVVIICGRNESAKAELETKLERFLLHPSDRASPTKGVTSAEKMVGMGVVKHGSLTPSLPLHHGTPLTRSITEKHRERKPDIIMVHQFDEGANTSRNSIPNEKWRYDNGDNLGRCYTLARRSYSCPVLEQTTFQSNLDLSEDENSATTNEIVSSISATFRLRPSTSLYTLEATTPSDEMLGVFEDNHVSPNSVSNVTEENQLERSMLSKTEVNQKEGTSSVAEVLRTQQDSHFEEMEAKTSGVVNDISDEEQVGLESRRNGNVASISLQSSQELGNAESFQISPQKSSIDTHRRIRRDIEFDSAAIERFREAHQKQKKEADDCPSESKSPLQFSLFETLKEFWKTFDEGNQMGSSERRGDILAQSAQPNVHVVVEGFVSNMSEWMAASDLIITKAGPGTIAEACTRGLPILMNCYLPGQEEGNVHFVARGKFGGYSPLTSSLVQTARNLLVDEEKRKAASDRASKAMDPTATCRIADDIVQLMISRTSTYMRRNGSNISEMSKIPGTIADVPPGSH